jgi:hypothetical protein
MVEQIKCSWLFDFIILLAYQGDDRYTIVTASFSVIGRTELRDIDRQQRWGAISRGETGERLDFGALLFS